MAMPDEKIIKLFRAMKDNLWKQLKCAEQSNLTAMISSCRSSWCTMYTVVGVMTDPEYADKIARIYLEEKED